MDDFEPQEPPQKYYSSGWVGGFFLSLFNFMAAIPGFSFMRWVMLVLSVPIFFLIARTGAQNRYQSQIEDSDPFANVSATGLGCTMIAIVFSVVGIIISELLQKTQDGSSLAVLCWLIPAQIIMGFTFGAISTQMVIKSHQMDNNF